jgi:hypothetical protein
MMLTVAALIAIAVMLLICVASVVELWIGSRKQDNNAKDD